MPSPATFYPEHSGPLTCHECGERITGRHWGHGGHTRHTECVDWANTDEPPYLWRLRALRKWLRAEHDEATRAKIRDFGVWLKAIGRTWPRGASAELVREICKRHAELEELERQLQHGRAEKRKTAGAVPPKSPAPS